MRDSIPDIGDPLGSPLSDFQAHIRRQEQHLAALRQELLTRQVRLTELQRRREELSRQLAEIDAEIHAVVSAPPPGVTPIVPIHSDEPPPVAGPARSAHRRSRPSLKDEIRFELADSRVPLTDSRLAERILKRGYQTKSKDFTSVLRSAIHEMRDEIEHVPDGYRLRNRPVV